MQITSKFTQYATNADLTQTLKATQQKTASDINCVRIGIIQEFYPENITAKVLIANKKLVGLNPDGSQILRDYPPIFAKVCYCNPFETFPLAQGMECVLLFCDREIESWFINGGNNAQGYPRMHDLTDAIAIVGIRSLPNMINILTDCLHLFYGNSGIQIKDKEIVIDTQNLTVGSNITQTGDINVDGTITAKNLNATEAPSGDLIDSQGKTIATVTNGIITGIS